MICSRPSLLASLIAPASTHLLPIRVLPMRQRKYPPSNPDLSCLLPLRAFGSASSSPTIRQGLGLVLYSLAGSTSCKSVKRRGLEKIPSLSATVIALLLCLFVLL